MSESVTGRLGLPLIEPGQAQKEMSHNEALARLDYAVQACVSIAGLDDPPADPAPGEAWIVGDAPSGAWAGQGRAIAGWSASGWRFLTPFEGMRAWVAESGEFALFSEGEWLTGRSFGRLYVDGVQVVGPRGEAIDAPAGGATIDVEARVALGAILAALRDHGLIQTD